MPQVLRFLTLTWLAFPLLLLSGSLLLLLSVLLPRWVERQKTLLLTRRAAAFWWGLPTLLGSLWGLVRLVSWGDWGGVLALGALPVLALLLLLGLPGVVADLGQEILRSLNLPRPSPLATTVTGIGVFLLVSLIPLLGQLIALALGALGLGTLLLALGSRLRAVFP